MVGVLENLRSLVRRLTPLWKRETYGSSASLMQPAESGVAAKTIGALSSGEQHNLYVVLY
jgi:hypothetical protein